MTKFEEILEEKVEEYIQLLYRKKIRVDSITVYIGRNYKIPLLFTQYPTKEEMCEHWNNTGIAYLPPKIVPFQSREGYILTYQTGHVTVGLKLVKGKKIEIINQNKEVKSERLCRNISISKMF